MLGFIDGYNFKEMEPMKYWAPPSSWTEEKKKETTRSRIFSGDWWAAEKKDGYFSKLVKDEDGNILLFSRSRNTKGEFPEKHEWVPHLNDFFSALPNGTCLLGELYLPSKPGSSNITTLLGCLKEKCVARQEKGEKLRFYAFDILAYGIKKYISSYAAIMNGLDCVVFTAGIGENSTDTRLEVIERLACLGIKIDVEKNNVRGKFAKVNADDSTVDVYVVPTNEELMIAKDTMNIINR